MGSVLPFNVHVGKAKHPPGSLMGRHREHFCVPEDCTSQLNLCVPRYSVYILISYIHENVVSGLNDFTAWRRKSHKSSSIAATGIGRLVGTVCSDQKAGIASGDAQGKIDYSSISDEEWKKRLSKNQYNIARKKGTERAFTGEYWNTKTPGVYHCICCDTPLFDSNTKFDSGTGWPSYYEPIGNNVKSKMDFSIIFMPREEVLCAACDAHLGHVFDDGPPPTGKRYCINSASLKLKPK